MFRYTILRVCQIIHNKTTAYEHSHGNSLLEYEMIKFNIKQSRHDVTLIESFNPHGRL